METRDKTFPLARASLLLDIEKKWPGNEKQESNIAHSLIPCSVFQTLNVCLFFLLPLLTSLSDFRWVKQRW